MDKLTSIKIKYNDGSYSNQIPMGVLVQNVKYDSEHNLIQVLGSVDVDSNGTIQQQINRLFNEKLNTSDLSSYVNSKITTDVSKWLADNVTPVGSAVVVDQSLSISGAAADAKVTGDKLGDLKSAISSVTYENDYADVSADTFAYKSLDTLSITYSDDNTVAFSFSGTANPFVIYNALSGLEVGKSYLVILDVTSGALAGTASQKVGALSSSGQNIASDITSGKYKDGTKVVLSFTATAESLALQIGLVYSSKNVTVKVTTMLAEGAWYYIKNSALKDIPFEALDAELKEVITNAESNDIVIHKTPTNYFDFSSQPWSSSDVVATYNGDDVTLTFTETANPIVCFTIPGLYGGNTYDVSFTITEGSINESAGASFVRRYNASNPHNGTAISGSRLSYDNHVASGTFVLPDSDTTAVLELSLKYTSKTVTLSDMCIRLHEETEKIVIRANAMNTNSVKASFVYSPNTGDCSILYIQGDESDKTVMIDCMDTTAKARTNMIKALNDNLVSHIDYFMISHYHSDHVGNIQYLIENGYIDASTVFVLPQDVPSTSKGLSREDNSDRIVIQRCADIIQMIDTLGATKLYPQEGDVLDVNDCSFKFWNCDHTDYYARAWVDYNECSLCCTMIYGDMVAQFTGDIGTIACGKYYDKLYKCNILKANHHSCGYAVVPRFMSAVFPEIVVSMTGSNVIYSTNPATQAVFATLANGLQAWCETEFVPSYVTGVIGSNIYMTISRNNFHFDSYARRCVRADEGIPVTT